MFKGVQQFFEKIRNEDEATRKRWMIIFSGTSMVLVVFLWIGYLNLIVRAPGAEGEAAKEPGFASIFGRGLGVTVNGISKEGAKAVDYLKDRLGNQNEIIIEKPERNFVLENLPSVPPTKLP